MSLFSWFSRKPSASKSRSALDPLEMMNADATVPVSPGRHGKPLQAPTPLDHAANRKNERMERRELLYTVVRDAMVRAGVLSASYKFKVLSLDQRGRQFLVMMDLAREYGGETARLCEIEALIAQTAKNRFDILVSAVYWRINDHVAVGIPQKGLAPHGAALSPHPGSMRRPSVPAAASSMPQATQQHPLSASTAASVAQTRSTAPVSVPSSVLRSPAIAVVPSRTTHRYDPIEPDEVAAFKRALAQTGGSVVGAAAAKPGIPVHSGPLRAKVNAPTGFEDTEMHDNEPPAPDLSSTQYGDLN